MNPKFKIGDRVWCLTFVDQKYKPFLVNGDILGIELIPDVEIQGVNYPPAVRYHIGFGNKPFTESIEANTFKSQAEAQKRADEIFQKNKTEIK
jgi:hypothetical protein